MRITRRASPIVVDDGPAGRTLVADLVPWNVSARVSDDALHHYTETWEPGSLVADDGAVMPVYDGHMPTANGIEHGPLIGRVVPQAATDGAYVARLELADTQRGREVHALAELLGATVSIEADCPAPPKGWDGRTITRTAKDPARLIGVAVELLPNVGAFPGATVTAVRSQPGENTMPTATLSPTEPDTPDTPDPETPDTPEGLTVADVDERIGAAVARIRVAGAGGPAPSPLARFDTMHAAIEAGYGDLDIARPLGRIMVAHALVDQITTDNAGVVHQGWINQIFGIVDQGRPAINAIGTARLPDEGMTINWPTFAGDLTTLVGVQATQKTAITTCQGVDRQRHRRVENFRRRIRRMPATNQPVDPSLSRGVHPDHGRRLRRRHRQGRLHRPHRPGHVGPQQLRRLRPGGRRRDRQRVAYRVFTASTKVQAATGQPTSVVLAGLTAFVDLGGKLTPAPVFNATGIANAPTLDITVPVSVSSTPRT